MLWLVTRPDAAERVWQVQPHEHGADGWMAAGDAWQVALNPTGMQRLSSKWVQADKPAVALVVRSADTAATSLSGQASPSTSMHWLICAPGHSAHGQQRAISSTDLSDWKTLQQCRVGGFAAARLTADPTSPHPSDPLARMILVHSRQFPLTRRWRGVISWLPGWETLIACAVIAGVQWSAALNPDTLGLAGQQTSLNREQSRSRHELLVRVEQLCRNPRAGSPVDNVEDPHATD